MYRRVYPPWILSLFIFLAAINWYFVSVDNPFWIRLFNGLVAFYVTILVVHDISKRI